VVAPQVQLSSLLYLRDYRRNDTRLSMVSLSLFAFSGYLLSSVFSPRSSRLGWPSRRASSAAGASSSRFVIIYSVQGTDRYLCTVSVLSPSPPNLLATTRSQFFAPFPLSFRLSLSRPLFSPLLIPPLTRQGVVLSGLQSIGDFQ